MRLISHLGSDLGVDGTDLMLDAPLVRLRSNMHHLLAPKGTTRRFCWASGIDLAADLENQRPRRDLQQKAGGILLLGDHQFGDIEAADLGNVCSGEADIERGPEIDIDSLDKSGGPVAEYFQAAWDEAGERS